MENNSWKQKLKNIQWVCGIKTYNAGPSIYACLTAASKTFNKIVVTDDGSTDETISEINRFVKENKTELNLINVSNWDPIPDLVLKKDHGVNIGKNINKTHSKAQIKNFLVTKHLYKNFIYFSLEDDVILYEDIKKKIFNRIKNWKEPKTDCEFFNLTNTINQEYVRVGNYDPGMKRRKLYDNAGDWTFCCFWADGDLNVGPDPVYPWGACLFPWLRKNQIEKKGQDDSDPLGLHLLYFRRDRNNFLLEEGLNRVLHIEKLDDDSVDTSIMSNLNFNIILDIDENGTLNIKEKK